MGTEPGRVRWFRPVPLAPWAWTAGASRVGALLVSLLMTGAVFAVGVHAQDPDSVSVTPDSLGLALDSLQIAADSGAVELDTLATVVDTLPRMASGVGPSFAAGVWVWGRLALESTIALTLSELVGLVPGVIPLRGGDYGTPVGASSFGVGGGRVRVVWDGFEWVALDGAVPDLSRIGLAGLDEVRVERHPGELRIEIRSKEPTLPEPETIIHVGTGDLGTNILRGLFAHPNTLGGALTFTMDRVDTRGPGLDAGGSAGGISLRYARHRGERGGVVAEVRRMTPQTDVSEFPSKLKRNDWNLRGRWRFTESLIGEAFWGASSLSGDADDPVSGNIDARRSQVGLRTSYERGSLWGSGSAHLHSGQGLQNGAYELAVGRSRPQAFSVDGSLRMERWDGVGASSWRARAESASLAGVSLFASYEDGTRGAPYVPEFEEYLLSFAPVPAMSPSSVVPIERPTARFTKNTGTRVGATLVLGRSTLSGAHITTETDTLRPLGLPLDRLGMSREGAKRSGYELMGSLPLPVRGFKLEGTYQAWDRESTYLPKRSWKGALTYYGLFKESENLEVWGTVGVTSRDSMLLPISSVEGDPTSGLARAPFFQYWCAFVQVRIVTVSFFVRWENLTGKPDNFEYPDRLQPRFRTLYGVRWTMNN